MKNTARPRAKSARSTHHIPIGLQIVVKALDGHDRSAIDVRKQLETADRIAAELLLDPLSRFDDEGPDGAIAKLATIWGADDTEKRLVAAISPIATRDPHAMITDHIVPWQDAGLYLGLCLGFRIAANLGGKE